MAFPELPHIQTREDLARLQAHSQHSAENRSYLTMRIDDLWGMVNDPDGLMARLTRLEEKVNQQEARARRLVAWAAAVVPLVVLLLQYLLSLSQG